MDARYLAHKFGMSEQSIRTTVRGLKSPPKERRTLSRLHREIGLRLSDIRLATLYGKRDFANHHGISPTKLSDIEKGYYDLTITDIINLGLFEFIAGMDRTLLEND